MKFLHLSIATIIITSAAIIMSFSSASAELIILASPSDHDNYYQNIEDKIFNFHINFAEQIIKNNDNVIVLTDSTRYPKYMKALGKDRAVIAPMGDIWLRDFALSNTSNPILLRYTAEAQGGGKQGQKYADEVQKSFVKLITDAKLQFINLNLLNDGGNLVDDYNGNIVISTKFLNDNKLSENKARDILTKLPNIRNVAFIKPDKKGGLGHSDGIVSFVDKNTLVINSYPHNKKYSEKLKLDLKRGLPKVNIHQIVAPYDDSNVYDDRFDSACGLYTNALVTPNTVYLPQFGIKQDKIALKQVGAATTRKVIPVMSDNICSMGGGLRCMSWQLRGKNAHKLIKFLSKR